MKYIMTILVSYICWQWISLYLFATSIKKGKEMIRITKDKKLLNLILRKTGLQIESIRISSSSKLWGMMIGLPKSPYMILSRQLYENFSSDEMEYVVLHETGHYLLNHTAKLAILYFSFLCIGFIFISNSSISLIWILIALVIGGVQIQMSRLCEYDADNFAVRRMTNPSGMISATYKFENAYSDSEWIRHDEDTLLGRFIYLGIPYNQRIRNAEQEMRRKKNV